MLTSAFPSARSTPRVPLGVSSARLGFPPARPSLVSIAPALSSRVGRVSGCGSLGSVRVRPSPSVRPSLSARAAPSVASLSLDVDTNGVELDDFERFVMDTQASVCSDVERMDGASGARFNADAWRRDGVGSGFGVTRVLEGGDVFEKAAANVSIIRGVLTPERARAMSARGRPGVDPAGGQSYSAAALSLVFHPRSPMVPTFRADVRRFTVDGVSWFGGGADLTPYYLFDEDAEAFHASWRRVCNAHDPTRDGADEDDVSGALHERCKRWCDDYFYIPARKEHRGVGGIFFDDMSDDTSPSDASPSDAEAFTRAVAREWTPSYEPIVERRRDAPFDEANEKWHHQRRGRYVEFNLLYDRGVRFGLDGGRVESIMVSAPPRVRWDYDVAPPEGSEEARLVEVLRNPRAW